MGKGSTLKQTLRDRLTKTDLTDSHKGRGKDRDSGQDSQVHQYRTLLTRVMPALIIMAVAAMVGEGIRIQAQVPSIIIVEEQAEEEVQGGLVRVEGGDQVLSLILSTL